jgi:hypothetical protein
MSLRVKFWNSEDGFHDRVDQIRGMLLKSRNDFLHELTRNVIRHDDISVVLIFLK